jgi:hypothetical protein
MGKFYKTGRFRKTFTGAAVRTRAPDSSYNAASRLNKRCFLSFAVARRPEVFVFVPQVLLCEPQSDASASINSCSSSSATVRKSRTTRSSSMRATTGGEPRRKASSSAEAESEACVTRTSAVGG